MTSEGLHSPFQYLSSISESPISVPTLESSRKDVVVVGSLSNNNNNNFVVIKPDESVFETYPEIGLRQQEEEQNSGDGSVGGDERSSRSSDVNNPLFSLPPAFTRSTSLPEGSQSQQSQLLINNNNNTISTNKITSNHLSVRHYRESTVPYSTSHYQHRTGDNCSPPLRLAKGEDMYDSVMVSSAPVHVNKSSGQNGDILVPSANNHIHHHLLNNHTSKLEPNGNSIEIQLMGSQSAAGGQVLQQEAAEHMMMMQRVNNGDSSYGGGGAGDSVIMGLIHGGVGGGGPNTSSILSPSMVGVMSHGGGGVSLTSPGGSLEDQDCDEEKVINGDTFTPGDVPDPDAIKMFVGQIPKHLSESELKTLFEEFGRVFQINVLRDKVSKQSKGCCFVTFYTRKAALDAQNALHNVKTLSGMNHPIQMKPADNENRYERKLFVGMLSKKCNESDIRTMFSRFGHIDECTVLRDPQGTSRGCAFITFASKQCATSAIKALHHSLTMEGCSSPVVVKFADTQKDKDQKRNQQIHASILPGFQSPPASVNTLSPQYFTLLQQLQQQQQQQSTNYFSSLSPLSGIATLASLTSSSPGASLSGITGSHSAGANSDFAALAALANFTGVGVTSSQHSVALGIQAALAAALNGTHSSLSQDFGYSGVNGSSLGSGNSLASSYTGNGLHSSPGLSSYTSALRSSAAASKQAEGPEGANLFIYHLPPEATDPDLISMFSPFGTVISAKVYIDKNTNRSKCFGFVSYDNAMSAQVAIQTMNGFQVGMKRLKVQLKRSKEAAKPY